MNRKKKGCIFGGLLLVFIAIAIGVIIYLTSPGSSTSEDPIVTVKGQGRLRGIQKVAYRSDFKYLAFYGVPYAAPPVGELRFKAPRPPAPWTDIRNAKEETVEQCSQMVNGVFSGSEDCLYLNVYTPVLPTQNSTANLPVYFFIHGGIFQIGSPSTEMYGPDFLIQENIVVVTIQYRVNSLGFASFDTEEMPGNCALKDIIAALKWVSTNIATFGGDSSKVTVGGQSAGGALASWMTILPETKGLISQGIIQSGTAYHNWAYQENHIEMGLQLASILSGENVTDVNSAQQYLMNAPIEHLTNATFKLIAEKMKSQPDLPYQPTPERRTAVQNGEPLLVTHDAESYFWDPPSPHVPQIIGICNEEWRFYYFRNNPNSDPQIDEQLLENLQTHVPKTLLPYSDTRRILGLPEIANYDYKEVIDKIKQEIRNSVSNACNLGCVLKKYFDGIWMATDTHRIGAYLANRNETVYIFRFGVRSVLNQPFTIDPLPEDEKNAAQHGDDLPYTWLMKIHIDVPLSDEGAITRKRMVAMWTNFIKHGKPITAPNELLPVDWTANTQKNEKVTFLDIGENLVLRSESLAGEMIPFWLDLYSQYRSNSTLTEDPIVTVKGQGRLRGIQKVAYRSDFKYLAFYGVPYAAPPVGELRFKAPRPPAPWTDIRNATEETVEQCSQMVNGVFSGSEDCLYLNVYTPVLPTQNSTADLPVYFFIHGGLFQGGSPSTEMYGPDFLIQENIVVVTIQYRVNSLGFASFDTEEMPGNCALKDIIAALKWVSTNIATFGGDSSKVTVGGQSAGGALASWMTILPETKGLISQGIIQSGTAFHNWAYKEDHIEMGLRLASILSGENVTDVQSAQQYLMNAPIEQLTNATYKLIAEKMTSQPDLPYQPTPERRTAVQNGEPLLVTHDAESYFWDPPSPHVPQIIGICNEEWRFYYFRNNPNSDPQIDEQLLENLQTHVPKNLLPYSDTRRILGLPEMANFDYKEVIDKIKQGIRNSVSNACNLGCVLKKYFDGIWMATDTHRLGAYLADRNETVYIFRFGVRSVLNQPFTIDPLPEDEKNAAQHGDDLPYTWLMKIHVDVPLSDEGAITRKRMVAMWTNFIKHGKPITAPNELLPVDWTVNTQKNEKVTFLDIGENLVLRSESLAGEMIPFWHDLYSQYRSNSTISKRK